MTYDLRAVDLARDRLSQRLGVAIDRDDDFVMLMAAFASDVVMGSLARRIPDDELRREAREWMKA